VPGRNLHQSSAGPFPSVTQGLEASSEVLKRESVGIQSEIVEALVQLQFQDRVSQRMTHVRHNIERLPGHAERQAAALRVLPATAAG
jgi:methyl-accepting chemotaxis protein